MSRTPILLATSAVMLTASGLIATAASAATVEQRGDAVTFTAALGEANDVVGTLGTPAFDPVPVVTLTDTAAPLRAKGGCEQVSPNTVTCRGTLGGTLKTTVNTADGNDRVAIEDYQRFVLTINGGAGDDVLHGGSFLSFSPTLTGGAGDDDLSVNNNGNGLPVLDGGAGDDVLRIPENGGGLMNGGTGDDQLLFRSWSPTQPVQLTGGAGDDRLLLDGAGGTTLLDGGSGNDAYTFGAGWFDPGAMVPGSGTDTLDQREGEPLTFDASTCPGCVEQILGSAFDDFITGDGAAQTIFGGDGDDTIDGRDGRDVISGDGGDDTINARDRSTDSVTCGDGADRVAADRLDSVNRNCETVERTPAI